MTRDIIKSADLSKATHYQIANSNKHKKFRGYQKLTFVSGIIHGSITLAYMKNVRK
jgi:hypothetical protein